MQTLHVTARFRALFGKEDELRSILLSLIEPTRREDGCIRYELFANPDNPREFVFIEEWSDEAALAAHLSTHHIRVAKGRFTPLLEQDLEIIRLRQIG